VFYLADAALIDLARVGEPLLNANNGTAFIQPVV
jgi:hypothetical protein